MAMAGTVGNRRNCIARPPDLWAKDSNAHTPISSHARTPRRGLAGQLIVANVGILRLVTQFRRELGVASMNVGNIAWQQRIITVMPHREGESQNLQQAGAVTGR